MFGNDHNTAITTIVADINGNHWYVDSRLTFDHGLETMVFPCDSDGNVTSWIDRYAERHDDITQMCERHTKIIANIEKYI